MSSSFDNSRDDPLSVALRPPPDETPEERARRIAEEKEATRISTEIDEQIDRERADRKKARGEIKVLLLGPSGSGKSTTLKNLKLTFTPKALQAEAAHYTTLIYLNVITSLRLLCDVLAEAEANFSDQRLMEYCAKLQPVLDFEAGLAKHLSDVPNSSGSPSPSNGRSPLYEVTVPIWSMGKSKGAKSSTDLKGDTSTTESARQLLVEYRSMIQYIVEHASTQAVFQARNRLLSHLPGYFLDDLSRITTESYSPTDDDILRTRIRTLGVSETKFKVESGMDKGVTWIIYDVGGARSQRAAWVPYFDDVNTIIFLAPIGHFDQYLEEEPTVNCLKDTLELWDSIVSNKLLARAEIILFLNKYDILRQKLNLGIRFSKFVTSYRERNTAENVGRYLQKKFIAIHAQRSPRQSRTLRSYLTSVTDKSSTAILIAQCRELVLQQHFQHMSLI